MADVGAHLVEAPVSGSVAAAEAGTLMIMAAGEPQPLAPALPVLRGIGDRVMEVGGPGAGAAMKLAVNSILFAINQGRRRVAGAGRAGRHRAVGRLRGVRLVGGGGAGRALPPSGVRAPGDGAP